MERPILRWRLVWYKLSSNGFLEESSVDGTNDVYMLDLVGLPISTSNQLHKAFNQPNLAQLSL